MFLSNTPRDPRLIYSFVYVVYRLDPSLLSLKLGLFDRPLLYSNHDGIGAFDGYGTLIEILFFFILQGYDNREVFNYRFGNMCNYTINFTLKVDQPSLWYILKVTN